MEWTEVSRLWFRLTVPLLGFDQVLYFFHCPQYLAWLAFLSIFNDESITFLFIDVIFSYMIEYMHVLSYEIKVFLICFSYSILVWGLAAIGGANKRWSVCLRVTLEDLWRPDGIFTVRLLGNFFSIFCLHETFFLFIGLLQLSQS